jgi:hypothetical protein
MGDGIYGIYGIKDTYFVCKYVKKTVLELGFIWVWVLDYLSLHLQ